MNPAKLASTGFALVALVSAGAWWLLSHDVPPQAVPPSDLRLAVESEASPVHVTLDAGPESRPRADVSEPPPLAGEPAVELWRQAQYRKGELARMREKLLVLLAGPDFEAQLSKASLLEAMNIAAILDARGDGIAPPQGVMYELRRTGPREEFMSCDGRNYYWATDEFPEYEQLYLFRKDYDQAKVGNGIERRKAGLPPLPLPELEGSVIEAILRRTEQAMDAVERLQ